MSVNRRTTRVLAWTLLVLAGCSDETASEAGFVTATVETAPSGGDPDDPAIWVHPTDPVLSRIVATDKSLGFFVYDLGGAIIQSLVGYAPDNVDLRYGFTHAGEDIAVLTAVDRTDDSLVVLGIDERTGVLSELATTGADIDFGDLYGSCMYRNAQGETYAFVNAKSGEYRQYALSSSDGVVAIEHVRTFMLESQPEGCVADDAHGVLYVGEEQGGLFRIGAEPDDGTTETLVDAVGGGRLFADVEGMTIYRTTDEDGYLIVSSQGSDTYVVYDRHPPNAYITSFRIGEGTFDAATDSDGIDVTHVDLGGGFETGLFIAQDDHNEGFTVNFKMLPWGDIAEATDPPLVIDTTARVRP